MRIMKHIKAKRSELKCLLTCKVDHCYVKSIAPAGTNLIPSLQKLICKSKVISASCYVIQVSKVVVMS